MIDKLICILGSDYTLADQDAARSFFHRMRQRFIDWNYTEFESGAFRQAEAEIDTLYQQGQGSMRPEAASLLKGGAQE